MSKRQQTPPPGLFMLWAVLVLNVWWWLSSARWLEAGNKTIAQGTAGAAVLGILFLCYGFYAIYRLKKPVWAAAAAVFMANGVLLLVWLGVVTTLDHMSHVPGLQSHYLAWSTPALYLILAAVLWINRSRLVGGDPVSGRFAPKLNPGVYVFVQAIPAVLADCVMTFRESEGITGIMKEEDAARAGLSASFRSAWITLELPTGLAEVGITATVSAALAAANIPCNVVAAFHHDHLFVPAESGETAREIIARL